MSKYKLTDVFNKRDQLDKTNFTKIVKEAEELLKTASSYIQ